MLLKLALAAFLTPISAILPAAPGSAPTELDTCQSIGPDCNVDWSTWNPITGYALCVCSSNPMNEPSLAGFYTGATFTGIEYQAFGAYGQCYDLPSTWDRETNSMESNSVVNEATVCCVYTDTECNEDGAEWTSVPADVAQFLGVYYQGVRSFRCALWESESSECTDG